MGGGSQDMQARRAAWEAQQQTTLQQAKASDEAGPLPANWKKLTEDYIRGQLKDPDSGRFDFANVPAQPTKGFYRQRPPAGGDRVPIFCWVAFVK